MKLDDYITLTEIEERYNIKSSTIRAYIKRNQVIPESERVNLGKQWLITRAFAEMKWGKEKGDKEDE